jgi:pyruvate/2-oxoglutarate dehydrogenase complex dihydrolipoamide dehydrogenase (E3) component
MQKQQYDTLIIGFGKGGKTLAAFLAKKGQKVAVVEKSREMYGGTCINIACIPTKSLVLSAEHAASHHLNTFEEKQAFYRKALEGKQQLVSRLRQKNYDNLHLLVNALKPPQFLPSNLHTCPQSCTVGQRFLGKPLPIWGTSMEGCK